MLLVVLTAERLLRVYDTNDATVPLAPSGVPALDGLTGGMAPGRVWIVVGTPGQGRTTLMAQWAAAIALEERQHVHLVTPSEAPAAIAARLLSLTGHLPLGQLAAHSTNSSHAESLAWAKERVAAMALSLFAEGEDTYVPEVHPFRAPTTPTALVIDDADLVGGVTPTAAKRWSDAGLFVLLSLPRHLVLTDSSSEADIDPAWGRVSDVVLEVRHRGLSNSRAAPGDAELQVHYNRRGHTRTVPVVHQAHFSRFVDPQP
ncbi:DnaB-like helicase C-terminal domain-containing protein [Nocardioides campestrisoli]|uniref:DnaB-like helicase C-terminal domain-containing protein n=1 Tax=Nocardioides campestrisoli TaxID=2736757 RepID=UPI00163D3EE5|nr:DnaB-like helicase C-terminal domain-containing protein [Nocardioides campestrisoli]